MLKIGGLNSGLVLDHIKAGGAMEIYRYLNLDSLDNSVAIIKNAKSNKMGKKDIIKIDGTLEDVDINLLGVLDNNITVNIISNGVIVEKQSPTLPDVVTNVLKCKNPRCITSIEQDLPHVFDLRNRSTCLYRCMYCEQSFKEK